MSAGEATIIVTAPYHHSSYTESPQGGQERTREPDSLSENPGIVLLSFVTSSRLLNLSVPQFPHLYSEDSVSSCLIGL